MKIYSILLAALFNGLTSLGDLKTNIIEHNFGDKLSNSCVGKEDGEYWLLLSGHNPTEYMPVKLQCSNEYIILDINKDENLSKYFSSFDQWHYAIGGPKNSDPVNWKQWFLPENDNNNAEYFISPDCNTCDTTHDRQVFFRDTAYYMTGNLAKLLWGVIGFNECDFNADSYECYDCSSCMSTDSSVVCEPDAFEETATSYTTAGICGVAVQEADMTVSTTRKEAQSGGMTPHYKPSIGTDGRFCMCYQPSKEFVTRYSLTEVQEQVIEKAEENSKHNKKPKISKHLRVDGHEMNDEESADLRESNIIYLTQNDFIDGTLRIKKSGTYIVSEDIIFDFNKNDDYWPRSDQFEEYMGASCTSSSGTGCRDPYHLGFFAGIAIESDYVTIDLNNHVLKQSLDFYYQQRWFALIEFGNQQFLPGQGPGFFGANAINIQDVTVKNGILGLTSHFAIHGNYPKNVLIENVHIRDFVTHGMQLNGWNNLEMNDIEIGPSSMIEYLRGDYAHGRIMRQRLQWIADTMIDEGTILTETMSFVGKKTSTVLDLIDEMDEQMAMALDYAKNRAQGGLYADNDYVDPQYTQDEEGQIRWQNAKQQFIHESGLPSASSITGLFLNFMGASVFSYAKITTHQSSGGKLNNIYIHDIKHDMVESVRIADTDDSGQTYPTPWNSDLPAEGVFGSKDNLVKFRGIVSVNDDITDDSEEIDVTHDLSQVAYVGNVMTDAYITMGTVSDDWNYLGFLQISRDDDFTLSNWAQGKGIASSSWRFGCNQDIMGHSGKGLIGLRVDGVTQLEMNNIRIENLKSKSKLGTMACGNYEGMSFFGEGGHFKQTSPMQIGFSGNNMQGISIISSSDVSFGDITIENLQSDFGEGYGISLWTANDVTVKNDALIVVNNIQTGVLMKEDNELTYESYPNRAPEACAIRMETDSTSELYDSNLIFESGDEGINVGTCNIVGHASCLGIDTNGQTMYGNYLSDDKSMCDSINSLDDLQTLQSNENENKNKNAVSIGTGLSQNNDLQGLSIMLTVMVVSSVISLIAFMLCNRYFCNAKMTEARLSSYNEIGNESNGTPTTQQCYGTI